jgi:hypothetical protein
MSEETTPPTTEEAGEATAALLTAAQVAERLGISTRRLRDWRKDGRITEVGRFKRGTARIPHDIFSSRAASAMGAGRAFCPGDVRGMEALAYASLFQVSTAIFQPSPCRRQTTT